MHEYSFEKLNLYNNSRKLTVIIYSLLDKFPKKEEFALSNQIRRAIISVPSNIVEQSGRSSFKEKIRFLEIAYSSLMEVYCQLQLAVDLNYITSSEFDNLKPMFHLISAQISGLRRSFSQTNSSD